MQFNTRIWPICVFLISGAPRAPITKDFGQFPYLKCDLILEFHQFVHFSAQIGSILEITPLGLPPFAKENGPFGGPFPYEQY